MSVTQTDTVDAIGIDKGSGQVVLTITDHLPWGSEDHLRLLQNKLNTYLAFVESGELVEAYPGGKGRGVLINVVTRYELDDAAKQFFRKACAVVESAEIELRYQTHGAGVSDGSEVE